MTLARMTALAGVSRATYYRFDPETVPAVRDVDLRDAIQRIALKHPAYGRPRITAELKRQGWEVNHKRVGRILCEDNLLCIRKRKFQSTTDSKHTFPVHANLLRNFVPSQPNQVWVADITYIRLADEFVYLAVVLDAYSRLVIGWNLERTLEARLAVAALRMALSKREVPQGLIHHSDRGVQYACADYTKILEDHEIRISMSRKGNPYDNARAESFMKTLKHEQVHREEYRNIADARRRIGTFLETTYNKRRLHSALGYRPPAEFDALTATMSVPA
ncbi:MAG: IS3 family transposase [Verrucomicrobia bacterium]|nr:IS3 family transposase [Verrucomicrobiota bacterium]